MLRTRVSRMRSTRFGNRRVARRHRSDAGRHPRSMSDHPFTWAVGASIGTHVVALSVMAALGCWTTAAPPVPVLEIIAATPEAPPTKLEPVKLPRRFTEPRPAAPAPAPVQPSMLIDD